MRVNCSQMPHHSSSVTNPLSVITGDLLVVTPSPDFYPSLSYAWLRVAGQIGLHPYPVPLALVEFGPSGS